MGMKISKKISKKNAKKANNKHGNEEVNRKKDQSEIYREAVNLLGRYDHPRIESTRNLLNARYNKSRDESINELNKWIIKCQEELKSDKNVKAIFDACNEFLPKEAPNYVFNKETNTEITDFSEENLKKLLDIGYDKPINNATWSQNINLSNLKENEIYLYKATSPSNNAPQVNNDLKDNCLIYTRSTKNNETSKWSKEISNSISFKSNNISFSYNSFNTGDTYEVIYKKINNKELLNIIEQGDIIYLSDYHDNDTIRSNFAKFIYNDTNNNITIEIPNDSPKTIPAGAIYGYDWMISNAKVKIN